ncbi:hypothetical protein VNO77_34328 [Canavalia gladiata]|uniref:Uncharacterized protein n=1 Tax=Canavalia gladiata TaxID=3824 RepID=A0AAN9PYF7_CANGL
MIPRKNAQGIKPSFKSQVKISIVLVMEPMSSLISITNEVLKGSNARKLESVDLACAWPSGWCAAWYPETSVKWGPALHVALQLGLGKSNRGNCTWHSYWHQIGLFPASQGHPKLGYGHVIRP